MKTYLVRWEIDIDAETPEAAAEEALNVQRDPDSLATHFDVFETTEEGRRVGVPISIDVSGIGETQKPLPSLGSGTKRSIATKAVGLLDPRDAVSVDTAKSKVQEADDE